MATLARVVLGLRFISVAGLGDESLESGGLRGVRVANAVARGGVAPRPCHRLARPRCS